MLCINDAITKCTRWYCVSLLAVVPTVYQNHVDVTEYLLDIILFLSCIFLHCLNNTERFYTDKLITPDKLIRILLDDFS